MLLKENPELRGRLARLSGTISEEEIRIEFTGLRPGEKLHEELITSGEGIVSTDHEKIMVLRGNGAGDWTGILAGARPRTSRTVRGIRPELLSWKAQKSRVPTAPCSTTR